MRFALALTGVVLALLAGPRRAAAELPKGRIAAVGGLRFFQGQADADYPTNFVYGVEGGYQPSWYGLHSTLLLGSFGATSDAALGGAAGIAQLSFAARITLGLGEDVPMYASGQVGVDLLRSTEPIPIASNDRSHIGPGAGIGLEAEIAPVVLALWVRYALIGEETQGLTAVLSVGTGD
ncbi:MAG: hypothetical protein IT370_35470 [Deltaproteobacteria bacterium]|nr:hypothetical protein [Deltaproteobacteria bacterium]